MILIDGRKIKEVVLEEVKKEVSKLTFTPLFCDVLVGSDPSSVQYVNLKKKIANSIGINFYDASFKEGISTEDLVKEIERISKIENMCGLIVQLPLPKNLDVNKVLSAISSDIDVDCLGEKPSTTFYNSESVSIPPTALACMYMLDSINIDLDNKNIVVLGNGELVGRPVSRLLQLRNLKYFVIDKKTENKEELIKNADIIISGMGAPLYLKGEMVKEGVVIIDAGTSESNGSIVGDVDFESVKEKVSYISPVPGGVGPVTVAMLFKNVLEVAKKKDGRNQ